MKKWLLLSVLFLSGCLMRSYMGDADKVNSAIRTPGDNQGYLVTRESQAGKVHRLPVLSIETGSHAPAIKPPEDTTTVTDSTTTSSSESTEVSSPAPVAETPAATTEKSYTEYKVEKNDTLQKISQKFYGTTKKWHMLYEENKDVLKGPDKIYPGLVIKVPNKQ